MQCVFSTMLQRKNEGMDELNPGKRTFICEGGVRE